MKVTSEKRSLTDIEKIKNFLVKLGFVCNSFPTSQNLIYTKDDESIIIKNSKVYTKKIGD
jgi:hypothetical protein